MSASRAYFLALASGRPTSLRLPGRVVESGEGQAHDPNAAWCVIRTSLADVGKVRAKLRRMGSSDHVVRVDALSNVHQGPDYARQLPLV